MGHPRLRLHYFGLSGSLYAALLALLFLASDQMAGAQNAQPTKAADTTAVDTLGVDPTVAEDFSAEVLQTMEPLIQAAIAEKKMPGCVVCFGRQKGIAGLKAFGDKRLVPDTEPMTLDTVFDMASITKPVATATSILLLIERGQLRLSDRVTDFFPDFKANEKGDITIRDLLIHQSGLLPDNALADYLQGHDVAFEKISALKLQNPTGSKFVYSDVNFILLGEIVKVITGKTVHEFSRDEIFTPLKMPETGYLPSDALKARAAPTEKRDEKWIQGEVHDPRAYALEGIAGHAGLFSTATDLSRYARMMLGHGKLDGIQIMNPMTFDLMTRPYPVSSGIRGLGWDKRTGYSSNRGDLLTPSAFGHGGFTGTVLWIDPELDLFFIFLSNRVHPDGKGLVNPLAGKVCNVVANALLTKSAHARAEATHVARHPVLCGVDVLAMDHFRQLKGKRIGLITNHTGRDLQGQTTVQAFHQAKEVTLSALFSPEHGFAGQLDVSKIGDTRDQETGLKVFSLYGETRRPTPEMLAEVDTLVFDIQDIGCRFYTYVSTMGEAMRAAAEHKKGFVVLDRPNPIGGVEVAGPMLDSGKESFVGYHTLPVRHGMTIGELAKMFQAEFKLELDLQVIPCNGWERDMLWDETGRTWINPSPNMRCLTQAILYPGVGLLETTNLSVGRGTDTPFEVIGAPWIKHQELAQNLNLLHLAGVTFIPIEFTPDSSKFANELCQGVNIVITDRKAFEPLSVGFSIAVALRKLYPKDWKAEGYLRLLGNKSIHEALMEGKSATEIMLQSSEGMNDFMKRRSTFLLYPER